MTDLVAETRSLLAALGVAADALTSDSLASDSLVSDNLASDGLAGDPSAGGLPVRSPVTGQDIARVVTATPQAARDGIAAA
ncbi:hypothetical protein HUK84_19520, partial [Nguyenibacter vanlangensis]|nr:hypothetical protein [Nguyenibacter vanlangensis]